MALGGPNIYPSIGAWLGISRELSVGTAGLAGRTISPLLLSCQFAGCVQVAELIMAWGSADCDAHQLGLRCIRHGFELADLVNTGVATDEHGHLIEDIVWRKVSDG